MLAREVLRLRGTLATRETEWDVMTDLYFYRDPEAEENKDSTGVEEAKVPGADEVGPGAVEAGFTRLVVVAAGMRMRLTGLLPALPRLATRAGEPSLLLRATSSGRRSTAHLLQHVIPSIPILVRHLHLFSIVSE
jgi:hypothetical protein